MARLIEELKKTHRKYRLRTEIITIEEALWLFAGIGFGWLAAVKLYPLLLIIPIVLFIVYTLARRHEELFGKHNIFGEPLEKAVCACKLCLLRKKRK